MENSQNSEIEQGVKPKRSLLPPLYMVRSEIDILLETFQQLTGKLSDNLKVEDTEGIISEIKTIKDALVKKLDSFIVRLKTNGHTHEAKLKNDCKIWVICETYKIISALNNIRKTADLEIMSNVTPTFMKTTSENIDPTSENIDPSSENIDVTSENIRPTSEIFHSPKSVTYCDEHFLTKFNDESENLGFDELTINETHADTIVPQSNIQKSTINLFDPPKNVSYAPNSGTFKSSIFQSNYVAPHVYTSATSSHNPQPGYSFSNFNNKINPSHRMVGSFAPLSNTYAMQNDYVAPHAYTNAASYHNPQPGHSFSNINNVVNPPHRMVGSSAPLSNSFAIQNDGTTNYLMKQNLFVQSSTPFSGKAETFNNWSALLRSRMSGVVLNPFEKLQVLYANTSGTPRAIIQDYTEGAGDDIGESTIDLVWSILKERYGSSQQGLAYIEKRVSEFPQLKNSEQKLELGRLIDLCCLILQRIASVPELYKYNCSDGMATLWNKLPENLLRRWRSFGMKAKTSSGGRNPTLAVFINFLKEVYSEVNDDFFMNIDLKNNAKHSAKVLITETVETKDIVHEIDDSKKTSTGVSLSVTTNSPNSNAKCPIHDSSYHELSECKKFLSLSFEERKELVWKKGLCFRCFKNHIAKNCNLKTKCDYCAKPHNTLMHDPKYNNDYVKTDTSVEKEENEAHKNLCTAVCKGRQSGVCSKTLLTIIRHKDNKGKSLKAYVIVDEQSSNSFVDPQVIKDLKINAPSHSYSLKTLSGHETPIDGKIVNGLEIRGINESKWYELPFLLTNDFIPDTRSEVATPSILSHHNHLSHLKENFPELDESVPVLMLIGADVGELMHSKCYGDQSPYAHQTPLGWAVVGPTCKNNSSRYVHARTLRTAIERGDCSFSASGSFPPRENFSRVDVFKEFQDDDISDISKDDRKFLSIMESGVTIEDGMIKAPLPFHEPYPSMPNNKEAVYHRTKIALDKLRRDPEKLEQCLKGMDKNLLKSHVEVVPQDEIDTKEKNAVWFLPVFSVTHPKKKKARLVFDASAVFQGESLNKKLLQGPNQMNNLKFVLFRFRENLIGITCDIEHMFYNFGLLDEYKDYLRFYWFRNNNSNEPLVQYRAKVHIFGASSSPAVASYGLRYAAQHSSLEGCEHATQFINRSFYVDDGVTSVNSVSEGIDLLLKTQEMLKEYGIRIHKFSSSHPEVLKGLPEEDLNETLINIDFDDSPVQRTLGVVWNIVTDSFITKAEVPDTLFTKRGVLSAVNSIYDPVGIAAPVILTGRLLQRKVIPSKDMTTPELESCGWDTPLPAQYLPLWNDWKKSLEHCHLLSISRCFIPNDFGTVVERDLHVFADASSDAIGVVIYLRSYNEEGRCHVAFVTGSSRVAPRSVTTIPRLELNAALQAANTSHEIMEEMNISIHGVHFYTDSMIVKGYINNKTRSFSRYVTRRVEAILKVSTPQQWIYISTDENPADLASRPTDPVTLSKSDWLTGPKFLYSGDSIEDSSSVSSQDIILPETVEDMKSLYTSVDKTSNPLKPLFTKYSDWNKIVRITKTVISYIIKVANKVRIKSNPQYEEKDTAVTNYYVGKLILKLAQREQYPELFSCGPDQMPENHCLNKLAPFIDEEGLLRVGGRIKKSDVPFDCKHPMLVPAKHPISVVLLYHLHKETGHQGRLITHAHIRQEGFHIEKGRQAIRELLSRCITCKRLRGQPCQQMMADLPSDRIDTSPPFTNCGLDVFGHFYIHDGVNTRRNTATKKLYVLLITCLVTRAVHLEPLPAMDTSSLQNALRRFFAIRGMCKLLRSDNGTNFIGTINQMNEANVDIKALQKETESHNCEWKLHPPGASHFSGATERKIGSVRRILENSLLNLGNKILSRDEMHTILQEAAAIVNCTPLYGITDDPNDPCPISPSNLLTLKDSPHPSPIETYSETDLLKYGTKRWRRVQYLADQFWTRWRQSYLQNLQLRHKWMTPKKNLGKGDLVLIKSKTSPRNKWPTAIINDVKLSDDGLVRSVSLKLPGKNTIFERCIQDVILLMRKE